MFCFLVAISCKRNNLIARFNFLTLTYNDCFATETASRIKRTLFGKILISLLILASAQYIFNEQKQAKPE